MMSLADPKPTDSINIILEDLIDHLNGLDSSGDVGSEAAKLVRTKKINHLLVDD